MQPADRLPHAQTRRRPRASRGFTLLEVLAAVAVLGLVYSLIATAAIHGLRAEGDATRRLRASLLADEWITNIEAQIAAGTPPALGETEEEHGDFVVRTAVSGLEIAIPETKASKRAQERIERAVAGPAKGPREGTASFLDPAGASKEPLLRRIDLSVAWGEENARQTVRRTAFGLDRAAAAPLIDQLVAAAEAEKKQEEKETASDARGEDEQDAGATDARAVQQPQPMVSPGADPADVEGDEE